MRLKDLENTFVEIWIIPGLVGDSIADTHSGVLLEASPEGVLLKPLHNSSTDARPAQYSSPDFFPWGVILLLESAPEREKDLQL